MSAGFTPGPWMAKGDYTIADATTIIANPDGDLPDGPFTYDFICTCEDEYGERNEKAQANARLIAAAPELYEALQLLLETEDFGNEREHWESEHKLGNGHAWRVLKAMDALAKARGEQP